MVEHRPGLTTNLLNHESEQTMATKIIGQRAAVPILPKSEDLSVHKDRVAIDYLGHPCQIAEAFEEFSDFLEQPRGKAKSDPRALARDIGRHLLDAHSRTMEVADIFEALLSLLSKSEDVDAARAITRIAKERAESSVMRFYELAGETLVALEFAGLAREVNYG